LKRILPQGCGFFRYDSTYMRRSSARGESPQCLQHIGGSEGSNKQPLQ